METSHENELTLRDLIAIYRRRRAILLGITLGCLIAGALYCMFSTRRYEATGSLEVQKESSDVMGLENLMSSGDDDASSPMEGDVTLQTQANILQSDTLALRTIEELNLESTEDFRPRWSPIGWLLGLITPRGRPDPKGVSLEDSPNRMHHVLTVFSKNLKVTPASGTRIIQISYLSSDPKIAAAVVNKLMQTLTDFGFQTRFNATNTASTWLNGQLGDLRKEAESLQAQVVAVQRDTGVYSIGTVDAQGREETYSGVLDRLQQDTLALEAAEKNRILKGAIAHAADTGDAEMLSGLGGASLGESATSVSTAFTVIQSLREQLATAQASLKSSEAKFGPAYPPLTEMRASIADLNRSIQNEIKRIKERADNDALIAAQSEAQIRTQYDEDKKQADQLNDKAIQFTILHQEAEESRELYEDLLKRLKEAGVLAGLKSTNITVVDPSRVPAKPSKPNVLLYMIITLGGGLFIGMVGAFWVDALDNKINTIGDLEEEVGETILGALPLSEFPRTKRQAFEIPLAAVDEPQSTFTEALRAIRTALLLARSDAPPQVIMMTSSIAGEGKTTCAVNMAVVFAGGGKRTLLVDTDLRRGQVHRRLNIPQGVGLSNLLAGQTSQPSIQAIPGIPNLDVLIAGPPPPNPTDLLASETMRNWLQRWRETYDIVLLDSAPVLPVSDSVPLAALTDATVLLVRCQLTERSQATRSYDILRRGGKQYVGLVLNGMSTSESSYYGYYGYRKNAYPYAEDKNAKS